jgi:cell division protein FtsL
MAKRRVKPRGRSRLALALLAFVLVAVLIVWRRAEGVDGERAIEQLAAQRRMLEAERARLESQIREAESLGRIGPIAERRLGMRIATDTGLVTLPRRVGER